MPTLLRTLFFCLLLNDALAQPTTFLSYSLAEGLAQSQVYTLCEDSRGYLWCGTQGGGLSRFDGADFQTFNSSKGLPSDFINTLYEDSQKRLWIGTNQGYGGCEQSQFCAGFKGDYQVNAICEAPQQEIWLGTDKGILSCKNLTDTPRKRTFPNIPQPYSCRAFCASSQGIWVGTNRGAYLIGGKHPLALEVKNGLPVAVVNAMEYDQNGHLWIALSGGGIVVFDEQQEQIIQTYTQPLWPNTLELDAAGNMWIGTSNEGVYVFNPNNDSWTQVTEKQGLPHNHVRDLLLDRNGQMWIATSGGGIARVLNQQFRHFTTANGLAGNRIYALHADQKGSIWLAASQNGIQMLDSLGIHSISADSSQLYGVKCKAITADRQGRIWAGTDGRGVFMLDSTGAHKLEGLPSLRIQSLICSSTGEIWVATTDNGIAVVREEPVFSGRFLVQSFGSKEGLVDLNINTLKADGKGNIWFGAQSGALGFFESKQLARRFTPEKNGLPALPVRCLEFDQKGNLWAGYRGGGVWGASTIQLERDSNWQFVPLKAPLASQNIYLLLTDRAGHLWVGTEKGLDELVFEPFESIRQQTTFPVKETRHYGQNEGFLGIETCQEAAICDRNGHLWFGTMNGLSQYIPSLQKTGRAAPLLHFRQIALFYKPLSATKYANWLDLQGGLREGLHFAWNENHLSFEFRAIDLANPEGLRYRWRLEGSPNAEWSPFSEQQSVNFAGLQAGNYTFWVQAIAADGTQSEAIKASFSIQKPVWQSLWLQLLAALILGGLAFWGFRKRIRQVRKAELEKREKLEVENRLLLLEQKALQLQMNPHFIFNALNSVQSLISAGEVQAARIELNAFAQLMRSILSNSRRPVLTLKEEVETLEKYLQIEQFCRPGKPFDFSIEFAENMDPEAIELPPMLLQPFVENAVLHGLAHLQDRRGRIRVSFEIQDEILRCSIEDNGVGREKSAMLRGERQAGHSSAALQITEERLEALAEKRISKPLEFEDIRDLSGQIIGTKVLVLIPLRLRW